MEAALIEALVKERMEKLENCFPRSRPAGQGGPREAGRRRGRRRPAWAFWPTAVCAREKSCATLCLTRCGGASRRRAGSGTPSMNGWPDRWGSPLRTAILGTLTFSSCVRRTGCSQMSRGFPCGMITVGAFSLKSAAQPDRQRHSNGSDRSLR